MRGLRPLLLVLAASLPAITRAASPAWPDTPLARVEMLALLQTLNADLLSHASATLTLERWCGDHHLASPARIVARRDRAARKPLPPELRDALGITAQAPVRYRRVALACGEHVLSEGDNWYLPERLTPAMNRTLDTTELPFGKVAQPLHFRRRTLSAQLLWAPLPPGWEMTGRMPAPHASHLAMPPYLLQHRALLEDADGRSFSVLVETYTDQVLAFPPPATGRPRD